MSASIDAIVIGGGPSGSVAAYLLASRGWSVVLVEQHRFPRDKVCGECLSATGIDVLSRLGLRETIEEMGPVCLRQASLYAVDGTQLDIPLPRGMWGLSRRVLDAVLLKAAREAGAGILQPARVEHVEAGTPKSLPEVTIRDLTSNGLRRLEASIVIVADGKAATMPGCITPASTDFGIKGHFVDIQAPIDAITLIALDGHYGGVAPVEHQKWNVAYAVPGWRVRECRGNFDELFSVLRRENPAMDRIFAGSRRVGNWFASPLPRFSVQRDWPTNIIPVGNAAAAIEPIGGEGMGLAMRSAELMALELCDARSQLHDASHRRLREEFDRLWRRPSIALRAVAKTFTSPILSSPFIDLMRNNKPLLSAAMRLFGKM